MMGHVDRRVRSIRETNVAAPVFVFDAYGTLFDVHAAIARHREAAGRDADRLSDMWRTKQLEYTWTLTLAGRYLDFWTLTERALDYALARTPSVDRALRPKLLEAYLALDAFPDARTCLHELKRRTLRTAILSNGSPAMLNAAVEAAGLSSAAIASSRGSRSEFSSSSMISAPVRAPPCLTILSSTTRPVVVLWIPR